MANRLKDSQPSEVLKAEYLGEYTERREVVWQRLLNLRTALLILGRLDEFPFDLFAGRGPQNFWSATQAALLESSILRVWLLTKEVRDYRPAHLLELRDLVQRGIRDEFKAELAASLDAVGFDSAIADTLERVKRLRHKVVAHVDKKHEEVLRKNQLQSLEELDQVANALKRLFDVLCFGFEAATVPLAYMTEDDGLLSTPPSTDIDNLLLLVARASPLLNAPERELEMWKLWQEKLTPAERETVAAWRKRLGLPISTPVRPWRAHPES